MSKRTLSEIVTNTKEVQTLYYELVDQNLSKRQIIKKISKELNIGENLVREYLEINLDKLLDTTSKL